MGGATTDILPAGGGVGEAAGVAQNSGTGAGITGSILFESRENESDRPSSGPVPSQWLCRKGRERFAEGALGASAGGKTCGT